MRYRGALQWRVKEKNDTVLTTEKDAGLTTRKNGGKALVEGAAMGLHVEVTNVMTGSRE